MIFSKCLAMDLTQILTMSAMQGGEGVDPMQIMLMTQLLKDKDEGEGAEDEGEYRIGFSQRYNYGHG